MICCDIGGGGFGVIVTLHIFIVRGSCISSWIYSCHCTNYISFVLLCNRNVFIDNNNIRCKPNQTNDMDNAILYHINYVTC